MELDKFTGSKYRVILVGLFLSTIASFVWTESLLYSRNNLYFNKDFTSYRFLTQNAQAGGLDNELTRSVLAGNRLRTDDFLENNRVLSRKIFSPTSIEADLRVTRYGFVEIIFNASDITREVFRINSYPLHQSGYFRIGEKNEYLEKYPANLKGVFDRYVNLKMQEKQNAIDVYINDKHIQTLPTTFKAGRIGFEVTLNADIKSAKVNELAGTTNFSFSNRENFLQTYFKNLMIILSLGLLFVPLKKFLGFLTFSLLSGVLWLSYDYLHHSRHHYFLDYSKLTFEMPSGDYLLDPETLRHNFFKSWSRFLGLEEISKEKLSNAGGFPPFSFCQDNGCRDYQDADLFWSTLKEKSKPQSFKILYVGSSNTAGAGLISFSNSYMNIVQKELSQKLKRPVESVNAALEGSSFTSKLPKIKDVISEFHPDVVLVEMNYFNPERWIDFETGMRGISKEVKRIAVMRPFIHYSVLSFYPLNEVLNDLERGINPNPKHKIISLRYDDKLHKLNSEIPFELFDPNIALLRDGYNSGTFFLDHMHVTEIAHELIGKYFAEKFLKIESPGED